MVAFSKLAAPALALVAGALGVDAAPVTRRMRRESRQQVMSSLIEVDESGEATAAAMPASAEAEKIAMA